MVSSFARGGLHWIYGKIYLWKECSWNRLPREGDGVTIDGGVQKTCRRDTLGHGSVGVVVLG